MLCLLNCQVVDTLERDHLRHIQMIAEMLCVRCISRLFEIVAHEFRSHSVCGIYPNEFGEIKIKKVIDGSFT